MTLQSFVNLILREAGTALTAQEILEITNWAQNEILARPNHISRVNPDPFFVTTDASYSYIASNVIYDSSEGTQGSTQYDIREVKSIYSFDNNTFDNQTLDPASDKPSQVTILPTTDRVDARFVCIPSMTPNNTDCLVKWWELNNPGATTTTWRTKCYTWPTQITSMSQSFSIPAEFHDTLMVYAVLRRVRRREYGQTGINDIQAWYEKFLKQFYDRYSRVTTQEINVCLPRDF